MLTCASCGEENSERARFCQACASPLQQPAPPRDVRKTVTVLFCDVAGSTALGERLDPESLRKAMGRYFASMRAVLERHGGTVEKFIGDAVMAVFGIPTLHEDDALRAVRAADEMRGALRELNAQLDRDYGVAIETRTGVNTGEVVAGDPTAGQTLVTGDAVNTAARLEQAAAAGEVLMGDATYRLVRDAVKAEAVDAVAARGKAEPVAAWRLLEVRSGAPGFARRLDSPMVGRDRELRLLADAFARVVSERSCHLFTVLGSAGVGKSRLAQEFLATIADHGTVVRGLCLPYGEGITFWPVAEMVRQAAGITEEDPPGSAMDKLAAVLEGDEQAEVVGHRVAQAVGLEHDSAVPDETLWALRRFLESLARRNPLVAVFDDLQWAEPTLLDLVEHVADWTRDVPVLVLCLARPELLERRTTWGGGKLNATSILLDALPEADSGELIDNLLGGAGLDPGVRARIADAAEGNPLFAEEMVAMLIDEGRLERRDGDWAPTGDLSSITIPPTIHALIAARLDRLGADERSVLGRASVEGRSFHLGSLVELLQDEDRPGVRTQLQSLVRKELIRPDRPGLPGEEAFRFRHLLIRDAAYESLPKEARADLHERFAGWLERQAGERIREFEEIVGYHLERAHRYRAELGPLDTHGRELGGRAGRILGSAGLRALTRGDAGAGANLLLRAASLFTPDAPERAPLLAEAWRPLHDQGELGRAAEVADEALKLARAAGDRESEVLARIGRVEVQLMTNRSLAFAEAVAEAEAILEFAERAGSDKALVHALNFLCQMRFWVGDSTGAEAPGERAASIARRPGLQREFVEANMALFSLSVFGHIPVERGLERWREVAEGSTSRILDMYVLATRSVLVAMRGDFEEAFDLLSRFSQMARDLGLKLIIAAQHIEATVYLEAGQPERIEAELRKGIATLQAMGETGYLSTSAAYLAAVLYLRGAYDEAEEASRLSEQNAAPGDVASQIGWRAIRALVLAQRGESEEALRIGGEAAALARRIDHLHQVGGALMDYGEVLALTGRRDEAIGAVREALAAYEAKGAIVAADRSRAALRDLQGDETP